MKLHELIDQLQRLASGPDRNLDVVAYFEDGADLLELNVVDAQVYVDQLDTYVELTTRDRRAKPPLDLMGPAPAMGQP